MRKLFTLFLLAGTVVSAQAQIMLHPSQYTKVAKTAAIPEGTASSSAARTAPGAPAPEYSVDNVTSVRIGNASNAYGYLLNSQVQLSTVSSVGTNGGSVAFIHRQNWTNCGSAAAETGVLRYNMSNDGGQTWFGPNGACLGQGPLNPDYTYPARYPNATLFSDGAGTSVSNLNLAYVAPGISGTTWSGAVYGTANDLGNTSNPVVNQEDYVSTGTASIYRPINIAQRVPGEFWSAVVNDANLLEVRKGMWNASTSTIGWAVHQTVDMDPLLAVNSNGTKYCSEGLITFSPDGKDGYLVMAGDMLGGWDNCANAIICEYNLSTGDFDAPYEVSYNEFPCVPSFVSLWVDSTGASISDRGSMINQSATVDSKGNLHIHGFIAPAADNAGSLYPSFGTSLYDLTKDASGNWALIHISDISKARCEIGSGTNAMTYFSFADISRSPDGKYIMYQWSDTDTVGIGNGAALDAPNLKGRIYDVMTGMISPVIDWTSTDATWAGLARMPKTAEVALEPTTGTFVVPTSVIRFFGTPTITDQDAAIKETDFYYFSDVQYTTSQATDMPEWCVNCNSVQIATSATATATSTCGAGVADGSITIATPVGGIAPYSYVVGSLCTNVLDTLLTSTISSLAPCSYVVIVLDANGCESTPVLVSVNQPGAASVAVTSVDATCNLADNGTATATATGGNCGGTYTYSWSSGATTQTATGLAPGAYSVEVSCGGCLSYETVFVDEPSAIEGVATGVDPKCNGDANGEIIVDVTGGTPGYTYQWSGNSTATTQDLSGVGAGTYTLTVTDSKGCTSTLAAVTLTAPSALAANMNIVATFLSAAASGGTGAGTYTYVWTGPACFTPPAGSTPSVSWAGCAGSYTVVVTDQNGCTTTVTNANVAIDSKMGLNSFELFPNPATTNAVVSLGFATSQNVSIALVGMNGQTIMNRELRNVVNVNEELNLSSLSSGVYLVKVTTSRGTITRKLIIE